MTNSIYFKDFFFNIYQCISVILGIIQFIYNFWNRERAKETRGIRFLSLYPLTFLPVLADCIHDLGTRYKVKKINISAQIFLMILSTFGTVFTATYMIMY